VGVGGGKSVQESGFEVGQQARKAPERAAAVRLFDVAQERMGALAPGG
jgi:hypothetical protein